MSSTAICWPSGLNAHSILCLAWCLMPNHVHLILQPKTAAGLSRAVGEAHRRYTGFFNARARVTGHLFQGRFNCTAMDEPHLLHCVRYLAFNPVRAGLAARAQDWQWSSVAAHLAGEDDGLVRVAPLLEIVPGFASLLEMSLEEQAALENFGARSPNGRPLGSPDFIAALETKMARSLARGKPGRKAGAAGEK